MAMPLRQTVRLGSYLLEVLRRGGNLWTETGDGDDKWSRT